ncbi:uncharacterized protein PFLUO_LOCUS7059 [Penicillium psychrofluorescens]|uniref:uncharacterized protein n=1 Tax=Penicillium psychrofluorescens TaxID=3158075 RepID=UPI003CCD9EE7
MALSNQTVGFVGCGNMGGAVLKGVLDSAFTNNNAEKPPPISNFIATTRSEASAEKLRASIPAEHQSRVKVVHGQSVEVMRDADVVILGFKPFMAQDILSGPGVRGALAGKLVISMLGGQPPENLADIIRSGTPGDVAEPFLVKAIPNMGAPFRQSMTMIETPNESLPALMLEIVEWIFNQVGKIWYLPRELTDVGSMLTGASLAAMTIPIEGLLDGAVAEGIKRPEAMQMILQGLKGLTAALESGIHPAVLRESISSPRGCTIQGLLTLERAGTRSDFADALINGTRHFQQPKK